MQVIIMCTKIKPKVLGLVFADQMLPVFLNERSSTRGGNMSSITVKTSPAGHKKKSWKLLKQLLLPEEI